MHEFLKWKSEQPPFKDDTEFFAEHYGAHVPALQGYFKDILKDLLELEQNVRTLSDAYNNHLDICHLEGEDNDGV